MAAPSCFAVFLFVLMLVPFSLPAKKNKMSYVLTVDDHKEFKKILRTRTNVLSLFAKSEKAASPIMDTFAQVAEDMKGLGTLVFVDCSDKEAKKLCKKVKSNPATYELKHYKDGDFNKGYDRQETYKSMMNFLRDPTGDIPWEEDPTAKDVVHVDSDKALNRLVKKEKTPILMMFYAPWCGHCKRLKPDYAAAASELKGQATLAGMDVDKPENEAVRRQFNITGFPTILYFENGKQKYKYGGENNKQGIIDWMKDPQPPVEKAPEPEWSDADSDVVHLTDETFDTYIEEHASVLVMFYAPWCGHCKRMKPAYQEAAEQLKKEKPEAKLAAVDATKYKELGQKYGVRGYPTLKYFKNGKVASDYNKGRSKDDIVAFMKTPQTAPKAEEPKEEKPAAAEGDGWESGDVHHLTADNFNTFMQQHHSVLVMFYAPWCGHCKKMKPAYVEAAEQLKKKNQRQNWQLWTLHSTETWPKITKDGKEAFAYKKGRTTNELVSFMKDPQAPPPPPPPEPEWSEVESEVNHLTDETFNSFIQQHSSVLVMFYAPWCGHCKRMKPAYQEAAETLKTSDPAAKLAAVDATKYAALGKTYGVRGYPTIKYFRNGEDIQKYQGARDANSLVQFMKSPPTAAAPEWIEHPGAVVTPIKNIPAFDKFVQSHEHSLILFYKKELQKYKEAKGPFQKTATAFKDDNNKQFAVVDCEAATDLCLRVGIIPESLPTIKFYVSGKFSTNYKDPVTNADLYNFMNTASTIPKTDAREEL
ncbi:Protein disulfide-isomerase A5 [Branchiostoma belcheri]|nr:Protein disulfide-isomerase A5 [Branchiostoma belcheri]